MLKESLQVMEAWGFNYKSIAFQWIKLNKSGKGKFFGLGRWTRGNTEPCLLAVKGKPSRKSNSVSQLIEYPLGRHSAKPPITREKIKELMGEWKPKVVIWENVKNVLSKHMIHNFYKYINYMNKLGYTNNYRVLDTRDYGIPQARERVFTVSVFGDKVF